MFSAAKTLKKFKNIESPKMVSKRLYGHYLRSYEQLIKKNRIFTTKSHFPHGNGSKISWRKRRLCPTVAWRFFQKKKGIKKQWFQLQKHLKS